MRGRDSGRIPGDDVAITEPLGFDLDTLEPALGGFPDSVITKVG
jgi:hypothetical protein